MELHGDNRTTKEIDEENLQSKKVFIQFPIPKKCNFRCEYCFHKDYFQGREDTVKYADQLGFTINQFKTWMDTHIYPNFNTVVVHPSGGEPFIPSNFKKVKELIRACGPGVKFDFLTNGCHNSLDMINILDKLVNKVYRIGFTYHRTYINDNFTLNDRFEQNVRLAKKAGVKVYVKEILHKPYLLDILKNKHKWEEEGIQFKIQDFQNLDGSAVDYNFRDLMLIADEYKHQGNYCSCWQGWRSISIRGYDIAAGNIVACWLDPKIIGNIADNTLSLNFRVEVDQSLGRRNVTGGEYPYSNDGTFERDRKSCEH